MNKINRTKLIIHFMITQNRTKQLLSSKVSKLIKTKITVMIYRHVIILSKNLYQKKAINF